MVQNVAEHPVFAKPNFSTLICNCNRSASIGKTNSNAIRCEIEELIKRPLVKVKVNVSIFNFKSS